MGKSEDMKALIKEWLDDKLSRDIALLSRIANVPYTTLRRIWNEGGEPNCSTALALFSVIGTKKQCFNYLANHFPEAARFHEREFTDESVKVTPYSESLRPFIEDFISFIVLGLAYAKLANKTKIKSLFGELGLEKAHAMVEAGKLVWNSEDSLVSADRNDFFSFENIQDLVKACEHFLTLSKNRNGSQVAIYGGITDDELMKIKLMTREYCKSVKEMIIDSKGGQNFVALSLCFALLEHEVSA